MIVDRVVFFCVDLFWDRSDGFGGGWWQSARVTGVVDSTGQSVVTVVEVDGR